MSVKVKQMAVSVFLGAFALVAVLGIVVAGASGSALADVTTDQANFTQVGNDTLADKKIAVSNDTRSLYVELDDTIGNASAPVNATIYGIDDQNVQTQVAKAQISPIDNGTEMWEYSALDPAKYPQYRIVVEGNSSQTSAEAVTVGKLQEVAGGSGGFSIGGSNVSKGAIGAVVLVAAVLILRKKD
jgi:hypothetical protein